MVAMKKFARCIFAFTVLTCLLQNICNGCVPQVCRKRRQAIDGTVSLQLTGCSSSSPSWVRQIASCLSINSAQMAFRMKSWYTKQYEVCMRKGCSTVKDGATDKVAIGSCLKCWTDDLKEQEFVTEYNIPMSDINECIDKYLYSFLSNELPTLEMDSVHKGVVRLPESRNADSWSMITVQLPCKPRIFKFWNSYCVNSFIDGLGNGDVALAPNFSGANIIEKDSISFFVEFDDKCRFDQNSIRIIWSESVPTAAFPQLSSIPSSSRPLRNETGKIYFNQKAYRELYEADGRMPAEFAVAARKASGRRKKRQISGPGITELGVSLPCSVKHFGLFGKTRATIDGRNNRRFVIDVSQTNDLGAVNRHQNGEGTFIDFDIDYGFNDTGCIFDSTDIRLVVNPSPGWIDEKLPIDPKFKRPEKLAQCITCYEATSNEECQSNGTLITCHTGEACLTTVRQITEEKILITKACKQRLACENMERQNKFEQCNPGKQPSVCRCCCETADCNQALLPCI